MNVLQAHKGVLLYTEFIIPNLKRQKVVQYW